MFVLDSCCRTFFEPLPQSIGVPLDTVVGHGVVAGLQWLLASRLNQHLTSQDWVLACLCSLVSLGMDVDHFIAGGSLSMKAAFNLQTRPFAHTVAFLVTVVFFVYLAASKGLLPAYTPLLVATAFGGHQLRDSTKRGFTWGPAALGSSPLTPYYTVYLPIMALVPLLLSRGMSLINPNRHLLPI